MTPEPKAQLFVGLISGTSMDGIDAALVRFEHRQCEIIATLSHAYPEALREELINASRNPRSCTVDDVGRLDCQVGACFQEAAQNVLQAAGVEPHRVKAIGSHGQTLRHLPHTATPFTLQIGDPNVIAHGTGVTTVADFRRRDIAAGGEGAPLTPAFHHWRFGNDSGQRCILNLGGIANLTVLSRNANEVTGFDVGPANTLLDAWVQEERGEPYDRDGVWASTGKVDATLLQRLLRDDYFTRNPPKSTGFEHFNLDWLRQRLGSESPADVQATLLELTVSTIASALTAHAPECSEVIACGGGVHNRELMTRLAAALQPTQLSSTDAHGLDPDWVEAVAFAWLARQTLAAKPGNLPSVTGASDYAVLGGIYPSKR